MKNLSSMFTHLLNEVQRDGELRTLLVDVGRETERPHVKVNGVDYALGLVEERPMLMRTTDRVLVDPHMLGGEITEFTWKLKAK